MAELLEADGGDQALGSLDYENGGDSPVRDGRGRGRAAGRGRGRGRPARGCAPSAASVKGRAAAKPAAKRRRQK